MAEARNEELSVLRAIGVGDMALLACYYYGGRSDGSVGGKRIGDRPGEKKEKLPVRFNQGKLAMTE